MPRYAMTYVVYWPHAKVLKVGRAWRFSRVQMMATSGAQVLVLARGTDGTWEREALAVLRRWFPAAFDTAEASEGLLFMGRGWTECFAVDEHHVQLALDLCMEGFAKGNDQGINEESEDQRGRSEVAGIPARTDRDEADSVRVVAAHGRTRAPGTGAGADRGGSVPGAGGGRPGGGSPAEAGRIWVLEDLPGRWSGVDPAREPAACGHAERAGIGVSATAARLVATCRGCGGRACERARESGRAGEGRAGRACESVGRVGAGAGAIPPTCQTATAGRSTYRMPGSSERTLRRLRALWHRAPPTRQVGAGASVRGTAREGR